MFIVKLIEYLKRRLRPLVRISCLALGFLVLYDAFFLDKSKAHAGIENLPGFWAFFGFLACVAIIVVSKWFGRTGILTREDYYD